MMLEGQHGVHAVRPEAAATTIIDAARTRSIQMTEAQGKGLRERARRFLAARDEELPRMASSLSAQNERRKQQAGGFRRGAPIVYAVEVVVPPASLDALSANAQVARVEPGALVGTRVVVPDPTPPTATSPHRRRPDVNPAQLRAELQSIIAE